MDNILDKIPSRVKYYLLDWKEQHIEIFVAKYGDVKLRDLAIDQIKELFDFANQGDSVDIIRFFDHKNNPN